MNDAFSGLTAAYPMPDTTADSTFNAIKVFKGERNIERFYSCRSGEIERALRELHIVSDSSQLGVPHNNAVAERLQDVLEKETERHWFALVYHHACGIMHASSTAGWKI